MRFVIILSFGSHQGPLHWTYLPLQINGFSFFSVKLESKLTQTSALYTHFITALSLICQLGSGAQGLVVYSAQLDRCFLFILACSLLTHD